MPFSLLTAVSRYAYSVLMFGLLGSLLGSSAGMLSFRWGWRENMGLYVADSLGDLVDRSPTLGLVLLVFPPLLSFLWVGPLGYFLFCRFWTARRLRLDSAGPSTIYQAEGRNGDRRWCKFCKIDKPDRARHCRAVGRCLPVYDHFCPCLCGPVYLGSQKAYLWALFWIPVHLAFSVGMGAWQLSVRSRNGGLEKAYLAAVGFFGLILPWLVNFARVKWRDIVFRNSRPKDLEGVYVTIWKDGQQKTISYQALNPWDSGCRQNSWMNMGPWWQWPLFWVEPPIARMLQDGTAWAPWVLDAQRAMGAAPEQPVLSPAVTVPAHAVNRRAGHSSDIEVEMDNLPHPGSRSLTTSAS
ncbi:uncharacterized protein K452DRAFT_334646 [Aplosporella prunicola CBS 121167]|uniref:Palmitoyltransferase n=1 Tax=Aplosporella prunicola CBS 121167 TaxID=1176127 RepID=A0A6A6BCP3_9PEZI|nr:uncharacterized protein K452DRAFT_334646 [Aplosporella prunicola CBS 121167]KAF2141123.1 hypothetical protein K452DRAFT_334646 [Aplosporella prunicola CBS 121167]